MNLQFVPTGVNNSEIKQQNISAILLTLLHHQRISRIQLAHRIGVSTSTITNLISELISASIVVEEGNRIGIQTGAGRPQRALRLDATSRYGFGVHIDVGKVHVALVDLCGTVLQKVTFAHLLDVPWEQVLNEICNQIKHLIKVNAIEHASVLGIGVAASGLVDARSGVNIISPNLKWHDVPIRIYIEDAMSLPVVVENNVRAMALGEAYFGCAQGVYSVAFFYSRFGVGAGFVIGGQVFRGSAAGAGEVGHTTILLQEKAGDMSFQPTCLEDLISEPALLERVRQRLLSHPKDKLTAQMHAGTLTLESIFEQARSGSGIATEVIREYAFFVGLALANLINVFNPELIILGGLLHQFASDLMAQIERTVEDYAFGNLSEKIRIVKTSFGQLAGVIGASALVLDQYFYRSTVPIFTTTEVGDALT